MISQILAIAIFLIMFAMIISGKIERYIPALISALAMIIIVFIYCMQSSSAVIETLSFQSIIEPGFWYAAGNGSETSTGINWATIFFIIGMMVMVEGMGESGFFRWLCLKLAKLVHYNIKMLFIMFMVISAVLSMFIDSITVILFLATVTFELSRFLKFDPVPFIIAEIFTANIGGSATMSGDPPNIIIGTSLGLSFGDFLTNTGLIALVSLVIMIVYFYLCFRKTLVAVESSDKIDVPDAKDAITDKGKFIASSFIFFCIIIMLVTHASTGLTVATIGLIASVSTLIVFHSSAGVIMKKVDWKTVAFFIGLFIVVGGLEQTKVLDLLANFIKKVSGGNLKIMIAIIIWISAIASAFIDNIPFAATMVPVINSLSISTGMDLNVLAWALAIGTDIGGNATPIGASANVVGTSIAAVNNRPISWGQYCKIAAPASVITVGIGMFMLFIRYC